MKLRAIASMWVWIGLVLSTVTPVTNATSSSSSILSTVFPTTLLTSFSALIETTASQPYNGTLITRETYDALANTTTVLHSDGNLYVQNVAVSQGGLQKYVSPGQCVPPSAFEQAEMNSLTLLTYYITNAKQSPPPTTSSPYSFSVSAPYPLNLTNQIRRGIDVQLWRAMIYSPAGQTTTGLTVTWYFGNPSWKFYDRINTGVGSFVAALGQGPLGWYSLVGLDVSGTFTLPTGVVPVSYQMNIIQLTPGPITGLSLKGLCTPPPTTVAPPANPNGTTAAPSSTTAPIVPLPTLPPEFTAFIETSMMEVQKTFRVRETYSSIQLRSRTTLDTLSYSQPNVARYTVYVVNEFQLAFQVTEVLASPDITTWTDANGTLATPATCSKTVFDVPLLTTTQDLLLLSSTRGNPRYMGSTTTRGIPSNIWYTELTGDQWGAHITWYFAVKSWQFAEPPAGMAWGAGGNTLLRIEIVGYGVPIMFVHHPFYQMSTPVPADALAACMLFWNGMETQCGQDGGYYQHVHEFVFFTPQIDTTELIIPTVCSANTVLNAVPLNQANCPSGYSDAAMFFIFIIGLLVGAILWGTVSMIRRRKLIAAQQQQQQAAAAGSAGGGDTAASLAREGADTPPPVTAGGRGRDLERA